MFKIFINATKYMFFQFDHHPLRSFCLLTILFTVISTYNLNSKIFWFLLAVSFILIASLRSRRKLLLFIAIFIGIFSFNFYEKISIHKSEFIIREINSCNEIQGVIVRDPILDHEETKYVIRIFQICDERVEENINLLIKVNKYPLASVGDKCLLTIDQSSSYQNDKYIKYLQSNGISGSYSGESLNCISLSPSRRIDLFTKLRTILYSFKTEITKRVSQSVLEPYASLWLGIMFGDDHLFSDDMTNIFKLTQTTHIIAASGFNIATVEGIFDKLSKHLIRMRIRLLLIILAVFPVCVFADMSGSIIRAYLMMIFSKISKLSGRKYDPFDALLYSTVLLQIVGFKPVQNIGYLLSSAATIGVVIIYPIIRSLFERLSRYRNLFNLIDDILLGFSSSISVYPIVMMFFGGGSLLGVITNFIVSDLVELIFFLGGAWAIFLHRLQTVSLLILIFQQSILSVFIRILAIFSDWFQRYLIFRYIDSAILVVGSIILLLAIYKRMKVIFDLYSQNIALEK